MQDMQDGLSLVYLYKVDESGDQPTFEKLSVVIEKSVPKSATGEALYNKGELWVRLLEKAYARTGYSVAGANKPFRYEDIASGQGTFALRVLLGEAALHYTVASGPTLEDGQYFGLPVTTSVKGGNVSTKPTPLSVPWDNAMYSGVPGGPGHLPSRHVHADRTRTGGPYYVQQQRHGVQRFNGAHVAAGKVLYTASGGKYVPLSDARTYRLVQTGVTLPGNPGEQFLELYERPNTQWAKPADVTLVESPPSTTPRRSTAAAAAHLDVQDGRRIVGPQRVLATDLRCRRSVCSPRVGWHKPGGPSSGRGSSTPLFTPGRGVDPATSPSTTSARASTEHAEPHGGNRGAPVDQEHQAAPGQARLERLLRRAAADPRGDPAGAARRQAGHCGHEEATGRSFSGAGIAGSRR